VCRCKAALPIRTVVTIIITVLMLCTPHRSWADEPATPHRLTWKWPRFRIIEYGLTAAVYVQLAFLEFRVKPPQEPRWSGNNDFDDAMRDAFRQRSTAGRERAGDISDPLPIILQGYPIIVDSILLPLVFDRGNWDVFWQMSMLNLQASAVQGMLNRIAIAVAGRERPSVEECRKDEGYDKYCGSGSRSSFFSGHTGGAFVGAGMMCAHHLHMPLYGGGAGDIIACALPLVTATTTGVLRLMADRHYMSDVLVGSAVGFFAGFGLPTLFHYRWPFGEPAGPGSGLLLAPQVNDDELGISLRGQLW